VLDRGEALRVVLAARVGGLALGGLGRERTRDSQLGCLRLRLHVATTALRLRGGLLRCPLRLRVRSTHSRLGCLREHLMSGAIRHHQGEAIRHHQSKAIRRHQGRASAACASTSASETVLRTAAATASAAFRLATSLSARLMAAFRAS
jgi:hypothetical protein